MGCTNGMIWLRIKIQKPDKTRMRCRHMRVFLVHSALALFTIWYTHSRTFVNHIHWPVCSIEFFWRTARTSHKIIDLPQHVLCHLRLRVQSGHHTPLYPMCFFPVLWISLKLFVYVPDLTAKILCRNPRITPNSTKNASDRQQRPFSHLHSRTSLLVVNIILQD